MELTRNFSPLRKQAYSNTLENLPAKCEKFQIKIPIFFLCLLKNIDCGYSLEPPRRGGSNEYPQSMFWAEIWKIMYTPVNPSFTIWKWGLRGSTLYRHVFVMKKIHFQGEAIQSKWVWHPFWKRVYSKMSLSSTYQNFISENEKVDIYTKTKLGMFRQTQNKWGVIKRQWKVSITWQACFIHHAYQPERRFRKIRE